MSPLRLARGLESSGVRLFPGNNIGYFGPYEHLLRAGGDRGAHWTGCAAGLWTLGLEADGKIKGCPSLPSGPYTGGNLKRDRLAEIVVEPIPDQADPVGQLLHSRLTTSRELSHQAPGAWDEQLLRDRLARS